MVNPTLPLFDEMPAVPPAEAGPAPRPAHGDAEGHLRAAWKLSRSMRRFADRSEQQTRAGIAICRHLQALLAEQQRTGG
jgi:hypothetical protein